MALTKEQLAAREGRLTASGVGVLVGADTAKIYDLWRQLTGDPKWVAPDLSQVWPVRLGEATEQLHIDWLAGKHGEVSRRGEVVFHPSLDWAACTLDGWLVQRGCPVEVKHVGGFESRETIVQRYYPQMTWQMLCCETGECMFSVIEGAREPIQEIINFNEDYAVELLERAHAFMRHVWNLSEPVELPPVGAMAVLAIKEYDYRTHNLFCDLAGQYLETKGQASIHERAKKRIKEIIPADAQKVFGGGIEVSRDRSGRLNIKGA